MTYRLLSLEARWMRSLIQKGNTREEEEHKFELHFGSGDLEVTERQVEVSSLGIWGCGSGVRREAWVPEVNPGILILRLLIEAMGRNEFTQRKPLKDE